MHILLFLEEQKKEKLDSTNWNY